MNRTDAVIKIDEAARSLEMAQELLRDLCCVYSMDNRIQDLIRRLDDLRVDVMSADLPRGALERDQGLQHI